MADPIIPANQRNSFPLETVTGAQQASDIRIVGGMVVKYWGPTATNINNTQATDDGNGHICCIGRYLDMTGCSIGVALIERRDTATPPLAIGVALASGMLLQMQYRLDKTTAPPSSLATLPASAAGLPTNLLQCGMVPIQLGFGFIFAASTLPLGPPSLNKSEYALLSWGPSVSSGSGANPSPASIGSDVRFILSWARILGGVPNTNTFFLSVWGSS